MIGYLTGRVLSSSPESILLNVHGVGYRLQVPMTTYYEIQKAGDEELSLFVYTNVREDALELFGFWTEREKLLFEKLIAVSGIGPKLARVILSGMAPRDLLAALSTGDIARLSTIPGIGKKTAERMVLELRDKVQDLAEGLPEVEPVVGPDDDLVTALVNLGYKERQAGRAVAEVRSDNPDAEFHDLLRLSLQRLSRA